MVEVETDDPGVASVTEANGYYIVPHDESVIFVSQPEGGTEPTPMSATILTD